MDVQPTIMQGFIEHTLTWALALPVQVRHELIVAARDQARLTRQAPLSGTPATHFGDPAVWEEIAQRIEGEGHTPAD